MKKIAFLTFGCKLNFSETSSISKTFLNDGFELVEIAEAAIYPHFSADGGVDSERSYMKQVVQKYVVDENTPDDLISIKPPEDGNASLPPY